MVESGRNPWKMFALQRISVGEPLENSGQLVRLNLAEAQGAIPSLTSPRAVGSTLWDLGVRALDDQSEITSWLAEGGNCLLLVVENLKQIEQSGHS